MAALGLAIACAAIVAWSGAGMYWQRTLDRELAQLEEPLARLAYMIVRDEHCHHLRRELMIHRMAADAARSGHPWPPRSVAPFHRSPNPLLVPPATWNPLALPRQIAVRKRAIARAEWLIQRANFFMANVPQFERECRAVEAELAELAGHATAPVSSGP